MSLGLGLSLAKQARGTPISRAEFAARVTTVLGGAPVAGYLPASTDTTTSTCPWSGRTWTAGADAAAQQSVLGSGTARSFASASSQYSATPDTANLSFGNGTTDSPFSVVALVNVTDTAAVREIISKWTTVGSNEREWEVDIAGGDKLRLFLADDSAGVFASRLSDAVITQGAWKLFATTYDGTGGATAANGIVLYENGVVIASTPTNDAAYVAMEDKAAACEIATIHTHTTQFYDGSMAFVAVCTGVKTATQLLNLTALCRQHFGVPV